jgi:Domain of unknown function (DUF4260)
MSVNTTYSGAADGGVRDLLRAEGLFLLAAAMALYGHIGGDWRMFALLFLAPDLSFAGYLAGPRIGALSYNVMHAMIAPLLFGAAGIVLGSQMAMSVCLIWLAHIGFDRALGYGLKHAKVFAFTHLGRIGRLAAES